jgi:hypothetical protein
MTDDIKRRIERLLEEPDVPPEQSFLRARLTATLSEGLAGSAEESDFDAGDPASMAAFIDGQLTGAERDKHAAALARHQGLRADMESAATLVDSINSSPSKVPAGLLARASVQFAPAAPRPAAARSESRWQLSALWPRQRVAWAVVAALLVVVIAPAALMVGGRVESPLPQFNEPELSVSPGPDEDDSGTPACDDKADKTLKDEKSKTDVTERKDTASAPATSKDSLAPNAKDPVTSNPKDPCPTPVSKDGVGTDK